MGNLILALVLTSVFISPLGRYRNLVYLKAFQEEVLLDTVVPAYNPHT